MRPDGPRDPVAGPESGPEAPFPVKVGGPIIKGFGRGSRELGIPTANIPLTGLSIGGHDDLESGVYYGWSGVDFDKQGDGRDSGVKGQVYPMVMSIGWNPFYKNKIRSVEVHVMHEFEEDFYGLHMNLVILGYIRPEYDYVSKDSLIEDIKTDIEVARNSLERPAYAGWRENEYLTRFPRKDND